MISNISSETLDEFFYSLGVPKKLSDILINISQYDKIKNKKKNLYYFLDEDYYSDIYNVFIYETCRYPPNSNPHKTLN
jgi:hypothetical protein